MSGLEPLLFMGMQLLVVWAVGKGLDISGNKLWNYIKNKKEEKILDEIITELCNEYRIDKDKLKNELTNFDYKDVKNKLDKFGIDDKFLDEYIKRIFNKLSSKYKDRLLIEILLDINSNVDELLEYFKGYEGIKELLEDYKREQEAKKRSFDIGLSNDIKCRIKTKADIDVVHRDEDDELKNAINEHNVIIIEGKAGAGKSFMLRNAIDYLKDYDNFVYIEPFFSNNDLIALDAELQKYDNFVIIWDDLNTIYEQNLLENFIRRISDLAYNKRFKFIGASRTSIYLPSDIDHKKIMLQDFVNEELVRNCMSYYNVKLNDGITPKDIIDASDKTPNFIISLFIKFKEKGIIDKNDLSKLKSYSNVIELWKDYINELKARNKIDDKDMDVLLSIALLNHAGSPTISDINEIYSNVFRREGRVEQICNELEQYHLVSKNNEYYIMHYTYIKAVEQSYPLLESIFNDFVEIIASDIHKLITLYNFKNIERLFNDPSFGIVSNDSIDKIYDPIMNSKQLLIICKKIIEVSNNKELLMNVYYAKAIANYKMQKYEEALNDCEEILKYDNKHTGALLVKSLIYEKDEKYDEALKYMDEIEDIYEKEHINSDISFILLYNKSRILEKKEGIEKANKYIEEMADKHPCEVINYYDKLIYLCPDEEAGILNDKGNILRRLKKYEEATRCYAKAYEIASNINDESLLNILTTNIRILANDVFGWNCSNENPETLLQELKEWYQIQ